MVTSWIGLAIIFKKCLKTSQRFASNRTFVDPLVLQNSLHLLFTSSRSSSIWNDYKIGQKVTKCVSARNQLGYLVISIKTSIACCLQCYFYLALLLNHSKTKLMMKFNYMNNLDAKLQGFWLSKIHCTLPVKMMIS